MLSQTASVLRTAEDMRTQLVEKALADNEFRQRLIADPRGVASEEFGITIPDILDIKVHESDKYTFHVILPPSPELDDEQLEMIAAGFCCCI